ncbi:hypothetical protein CVT26_000977 [Gymnopilus dilepis]|uniref:Uncharacterized protein n=1 Tax=Gymnopilus dilepis TaxID=231916 RepID=A0A409WB41_9AGAR|nr:hypothetical protein CVT26_000977 [Gymnopilus dilepis]
MSRISGGAFVCLLSKEWNCGRFSCDVLIPTEVTVHHLFIVEDKLTTCLLKLYDPTIEHSFMKWLVVDDRLCNIEITDTTGEGHFVLTLFASGTFLILSNR